MRTSVLIAVVFLLGFLFGPEFIMLPDARRYAIIALVAVVGALCVCADVNAE